MAGVAYLVHPAASLGVLAVTLVLVLADWRITPLSAVGLLTVATVMLSGNYRLAVGSPIDLTGIRLAVGVLTLGWLAKQLSVRSEWPEKAHYINAPMGWLFGIALVTMFANIDRLSAMGTIGDGLKRLATLAGFVLAYSIVIALVQRRSEALKVVRLLVLLGAVAASIALIERLTDANPLGSVLGLLQFEKYQATETMRRAAGLRAYGTAGHPIEFGALMSLLLPLSTYLVFEAKNAGRKLLYLASTVLIVAGMFAAVSRSSLIASILGLLLLAALSKPSRGLVIVAIMVLAGFVVMKQFPELTRTLQTMLDPDWIRREEASAYSGRMEDWPVVWKMVRTSPLIGVGYDLFDAKANFFLDNQYLKFAIEIGVLGLAAAAWLFTSVASLGLWATRRARAFEDVPMEAALLASSVSFALLGLLFDTFGFFQVTTLFFIIAGLLVVLTAAEAAPEPPDDASEWYAPSAAGAKT